MDRRKRLSRPTRANSSPRRHEVPRAVVKCAWLEYVELLLDTAVSLAALRLSQHFTIDF
jgi:hypothetical protein